MSFNDKDVFIRITSFLVTGIFCFYEKDLLYKTVLFYTRIRKIVSLRTISFVSKRDFVFKEFRSSYDSVCVF